MVQAMLELGVGTQLNDDYVVVEELSADGLAARYLADSKSRAKSVELKILKPEYAHHAEAVERFKREAELGKRLNAPNLVAVLDSGSLEDGRQFMALEHFEGERLDAYLKRHEKLNPTLTAQLGVQAASALGYAHRAGVVHRDVAPRNLLWHEDRSQLYVLNFDVARVAMSALTSEDQALGTPTYMAPEQIRESRNIDARADIWGLGVVLHELAAGRIPFEGHNLTGLVLSVLNDAPDVDPDLPKELSAIILRCLEKDPSRRYANMAQLESALRATLGPEVRTAPQQLSAVPPMPVVSPVPMDAAYFVSGSTPPAAPGGWSASQEPFPTAQAPHPPPQDESPRTMRLGAEASPPPARALNQTRVASDVAPGFPSVTPVAAPPAVGTPPANAAPPYTPYAPSPYAAAPHTPAPRTPDPPDARAAQPSTPPAAPPPGPALRLSLFEFAMLCGELAVAPADRKLSVLQKYGLTEEDRKALLNGYRDRLAANPEEHAQWKEQYNSAVRHWSKLYGGT